MWRGQDEREKNHPCERIYGLEGGGGRGKQGPEGEQEGKRVHEVRERKGGGVTKPTLNDYFDPLFLPSALKRESLKWITFIDSSLSNQT